ncbi:response regulator transcription factor [Streptomyces sp. GC420]|uniref:response regulator transcription factor n=1 Tax=Streptomyces sp. GC420 TaxID=2697568 RepID=UPI0014152D8C|nr:response regulator transcription factor [Streptomyces sp. GC420]NBM17331.1 response regulator [Streptomyces sp. GC420]
MPTSVSGPVSVSSHVSQHTSSHTAAPRSEHTPAHVPVVPAPAAAFPEPAPALRVLVADDNPVVRAGLTVLLGTRDDIQVVAEARDGREALYAAQQHRPDVILLDVRMPGVDGIAVLPYLVRLAPVMMLTYSRENEIVQEALRLGAGGYLVHGEFTPDQLVRAVRDIQEGRPHLTSSAQSALLAHVRGQAIPYAHGDATPPAMDWKPNSSLVAGPPVLDSPQPRQSASHMQSLVAQSSKRHELRDGFKLSSREAEVMDLIASGMNNQQIAATCFISEKTVKNHINRIFAKLHSTSRSEAIAVWLGISGRGTTGHA